MRTVLLTGATSYLGRALAESLAKDGVAVHAVIRPTSDRSRLTGIDPAPMLHVHDGATESLAATVADISPDIVFHLATAYRREHELRDVEVLVTSNVLFGTQLLEAMRRAGVTRFVNVGSYFERYDSDDYRPLNLYAATKRAFADILTYYADAAAVQAVTLTLFDVYGPGDWRAKLLAAIRAAQSGGTPVALPADEARLDLVYIDDVVAAFRRAASLLMDNPAAVAGRNFAVSSGTTVPIRAIVAAFEEVGGRPVPARWGAYPTPARAIAEPWRGPALPGWQARVNLHEGIRRFIGAS